MKKLFICIGALFLVAIGFYSCDEVTSPKNILEEEPYLSHLFVSPEEIVFLPEYGFKDTTITGLVEARFENHKNLDEPKVVVINESGEIIDEQPLEYVDSRTNLYAASFSINTNTTAFEKYVINIIYSQSKVLYIQKNLNVIGFSNAKPRLLSVNNPTSVSRPAAGTIPVTFTAKATDDDGQNTLEAVYMGLISQTSGEVAGSPFEMFDDGSSGGDLIASDSTFTLTLEINSSNQLQTYDIHYFAIDKGGLVSDTVKTTFSIVE